jgi:response regulator NasT
MSFVTQPFEDEQLVAAVAVARARAECEAQLRSQNARLTEQLQNRKVIERAKGMLMKRYRWSEHDAFRRLQKSAMNQRTSMANLAEAVVSGATVAL